MLLVPAEVVCWKGEDESNHIGHLLKLEDTEEVISLGSGRMILATACYIEANVLVQHSFTKQLEFISTTRLFHYYGDKVGLQPHHISKPRLTDNVLAMQRDVEGKLIEPATWYAFDPNKPREEQLEKILTVDAR